MVLKHFRRITTKSKAHTIICQEETEGERRSSSTIYLTSALDDGGWLRPRPGRFTCGNNPVRCGIFHHHRVSIPGLSSP
jgi:hypothetical protein